MTENTAGNVRKALELAYLELKKHDADYHHRTSIEVNNQIVDALSTPTPAPAGSWDVRIQARKIGQGEWTDIFPAQVQTFSKLGYEIRASEQPAPAVTGDVREALEKIANLRPSLVPQELVDMFIDARVTAKNALAALSSAPAGGRGGNRGIQFRAVYD